MICWPAPAPPGKAPGVLRVDAVGRGIEVTLIRRSRVVARIHHGIGRRDVHVRRLHGGPGAQRCREAVKVEDAVRLDKEVAEEVSGPVRPIHLARPVHQFLNRLGRSRPNHRLERDPRELGSEARPRTGVEALQVRLGAILVRDANLGAELDDDARFLEELILPLDAMRWRRAALPSHVGFLSAYAVGVSAGEAPAAVGASGHPTPSDNVHPGAGEHKPRALIGSFRVGR